MRSLKISAAISLILIITTVSAAQDSLNVRLLSQTQIGPPIPWMSMPIAVEGNIACIAHYDEGLIIMDVSDPTAPQELSRYVPPQGNAADVDISGNYAYLADLTGLEVLDLSDPTSPVMVGYDPNSVDGHGVKVFGIYAYVFHTMSSAIAIEDISDPTNPHIVGFMSFGNWGGDIEVIGNTAYITECLGGFGIWDISNPAQVIQMGYLGTVLGGDVVLFGDDALVSHWDNGVDVIDVSDPINPMLEGTFPVEGGAGTAAQNGNYLINALATGGLRVLDVTNPLNPVQTGYYLLDVGRAWMDVEESLAYLAVESGNLYIYDITDALPVAPQNLSKIPFSFILFPPHPNPFNPSTTLTFQLPVAGFVELEVFDINACRVGVGLAPTRWYPPGTHNILFDGTGLPSGVYLARLKAGNWSQVQKLVLLK